MLADTRPLRQPDFRRLWTANIITVIGAQLTVVAVPAQIYAITGSSGMVGLTGLFGLVPLVIFGLWGGALADHLDRRTVVSLYQSLEKRHAHPSCLTRDPVDVPRPDQTLRATCRIA